MNSCTNSRVTLKALLRLGITNAIHAFSAQYKLCNTYI